MSGTADDNGNSRRIANYVLAEKIDALGEKLDGYCQRADKRDEDHETRLRIVEQDVTTLKTNQKFIVGGQSTLTIISSAIAAWLGIKQ